MTRWRRRAPRAQPAVVAGLRTLLARDGSVALSPNLSPMLSSGLTGLAVLVLTLLQDWQTPADPPAWGPLGAGVSLALAGLGMAVVHRHPVVADGSGLHARGLLHFDIVWADIDDASVNRYGFTRRWGRQVSVRVRPSSVVTYARRREIWRRLTFRLPRAMGGASFRLPPLRLPPGHGGRLHPRGGARQASPAPRR